MSRPTISTFQRSKSWKKACSSSRDRWCWLRTTATCSIAFPPSFWVWMDAAARKVLPTTRNGRSGRRRERNRRRALRVPPLAPKALKEELRRKTRLSYLEAREYASIEERVAAAEELLQAKREQLEDPAIASDGPRLLSAHAEMEEAQGQVDELYRRWAELEKKKG